MPSFIPGNSFMAILSVINITIFEGKYSLGFSQKVPSRTPPPQFCPKYKSAQNTGTYGTYASKRRNPSSVTEQTNEQK